MLTLVKKEDLYMKPLDSAYLAIKKIALSSAAKTANLPKPVIPDAKPVNMKNIKIRDFETENKTLKCEKVKSLSEAQIANFLFLNGIEYEYEETFESPGVESNGTLNFLNPEKWNNVKKFNLDYQYFTIDAIVAPHLKSRWVKLTHNDKGIKFDYYGFNLLCY